MAWFRKDKKPLKAEDKRDVPSDLFDKCKGCGDILYAEKLIQNFQVCPACGYHFRITSDKYLEILVDEGFWTFKSVHFRQIGCSSRLPNFYILELNYVCPQLFLLENFL